MYGLSTLRTHRVSGPSAGSRELQRETGLWVWWGIRPSVGPGAGPRGAESLQPRLYLGLWALPGLWHPSQRSLAEFTGALSLCSWAAPARAGTDPQDLGGVWSQLFWAGGPSSSHLLCVFIIDGKPKGPSLEQCSGTNVVLPFVTPALGRAREPCWFGVETACGVGSPLQVQVQQGEGAGLQV